MDTAMKVDSVRIRSLREQRAWSQEHLAEVTGLGLRTIQRVEKTGAASYESARALAAVFELDVEELREEPVQLASGPRLSVPLRPLLGVVAALATGAALLVATWGLAERVLVDVSIVRTIATPGSSAVDTREWRTQFLVDEGTLVAGVNDLRLDDLRFTIVPTLVANGGILLEVHVFERQGADDVLVSSPRLIALNGEKAEVAIGGDPRSFRFAITPRRHRPTFL